MKDEPLYQAGVDSQRRWYVDGPGYGLEYYGGMQYSGFKCDDKKHAERCALLAATAYDIGARQFQLRFQDAMGLPIRRIELITDDHFFVHHQEFFVVGIVQPRQLITPVVEFEIEQQCVVASKICWSAYKAGEWGAQHTIRKVLNIKS